MNPKHYLFTSESVSEGHPDKVADQISDAILDAYLKQDEESKVACETMVTTGLVVVSGEIRSKATVDVQEIVRKTISRIGYNKAEYKFEAESCGIINTLHSQSDDIHRGVKRDKEEAQGAGDQGMMFGYATSETEDYMPLPLYLANKILLELKAIRQEGGEMKYLRPDAKSQVTVEYDEHGFPERIHTIVVSTQHDEFDTITNGLSRENIDILMQVKIYEDIANIVLPRVIESLPERIRNLFDDDLILHVNPTGKFVIGGPHGDTGLTGRKIIVDTYGGSAPHGGGAFSGKDPSKVDRSAAYAARYIAKNLVAAGVAARLMIQLSYAIGIAEPVSVFVDTYGTSNVPLSDAEIAEIIRNNVDLTPFGIIDRLKLKAPIYERTAAYGHFGRHPEIFPGEDGITTFPWEQLDLVGAFTLIFKTEPR